MESARFWPSRTTIGWRRESSVFRYLTDPSTEFPYVYQKALSLVLAIQRSRRPVLSHMSLTLPVSDPLKPMKIKTLGIHARDRRQLNHGRGSHLLDPSHLLDGPHVEQGLFM
jgi:hypothetical protein